MSYLQTSPDHDGARPTTSAPATTSPPLHHHADDDDEDDEDDDEDDDDLRKTTGEETFQQILQCPSDKHKAYDQQDFTDHRQSSLHAHLPRSTAHPDGKKKQSNKNRKGAVQRRGSASSAGPTIEEDKEEEGEEEEETDSTPPWPEATPTELTRVATEALPSAQSHRSEDVPGACRHLVRKSAKDQVVHATKETVGHAPSCVRKLDHTPNQVLVELKELVMEHQEAQWRGTFRWMKFDDEEDEDTNVWRKPPISSLTFRSLLELRHNITHGAVLLDVQQRSLSGIAQQVVEHMLTSGHISPEDSQLLLTTLLLKHTDSINIPASSLMLAHHNNHTTGQSHASVTQPLRNGGGTNGIDTPHEKAPAGLQHSRSKHELKIPHNAEATVVLVGSVGFLEQPSMAFVRLQEAVVLESVLELPVPVRFIFLLLGPPTSNMDFHEVGRTISTLMSDKNFHAAAYLADQRQDLLTAVNRFLDASVVLPPSEVGGDAVSPLRRRDERNGRETPRESKSFVDEELFVASKPPSGGGEDPLQRSGRVFGGLVKDVVRRYPQYLSDIKDALNPQCLAAIIFIYFAALSPAITFGGLLGEKTDGLIGVSELIVATSIQGLVFSVFSAQPLLIVGFSGPLLVFEEAYYSFCKANGMDYLTGRAWIGIWLIVIVIATVALEGSFLVRYVSRFTQEIFSFLISLIFIYETFAKLVKIFQEHPLRSCYPGNGYPGNETVPWIGCNSSNASFPGTVPEKVSGQPNIALLSLVLMSGTYFIAFYLRMFKNSPFFPGTLRRIIGDFGVPIAILIMVLIDGSIKDTETQKLSVPSGFSVSSPEKRGWVISLLGSDGQFPVWMMAASILPAILVFILLFMESQITALICSKSERMLVKGTGFHLDLLIIVIVGGVSALFGLPWLSAATVRSVTHTNALTVMTKGDKPRIQEVKEQRVTNFLVALLVGLSIVVGDLLRQIPLAVLFGIFLYMGVMSLNGIQLTDRLLLLLMPPKYHPDLTYIRKVRTLRMHLWTIIQFVCLGVLWAVMSSSAALAFPFILLLTIPVKMLILPRVFTRTEMQCLDADDAEPKLDEDAGLDEFSERHMPV